MNHKKKAFVFGTAIILIFSVLSIFTQKATADIKAETERLLQNISGYEFGQSREPLTLLADIVRSSIDSPRDKKLIQKSMLNFLKSDATFAGKQFVCKQLSIIGTEEAVPTLASMLVNPKTSDIARYALERIPGRRVDKALRDALPKTKGKVKIGIINTLGQRQDYRAVKSFGKLIYKSDKTIAIAATAALGKIANEKAAEILAQAKDKTKGTVKLVVLDSYLMCADKFNSEGDQTKASEIYKQLFATEYSLTVRSASLRGLVKTAGEQGDEIILKVIKKEQTKLKSVAIGLIRELPETANIIKLVAELPTLSVICKIQLLSALADRGDSAVHDAVIKATKDNELQVRIAALKAIAKLGNESDIDLLTKVAAKGDLSEKETARESLTLLDGSTVSKSIILKISKSDPDIQVELIRSVGSRNIPDAVDILLKTATNDNRKVRIESIKSLELIATPENLNELVDLLVNAQSEVERKRAEKAVVTVAHKIENKDQQADIVLNNLASVKDFKAKCSLLHVLGNIGDSNALPVLREALKNKNETIQKAGIQALSDWSSPEPLTDLLTVTKTSKNEIHKTLALRGYIRLLGLKSERTDYETIELYLTAMNLASNANEKKMVLSGISNVRTPRALNTAAKYLTEADLKAEAEVAVVKIARSTRSNFPEETKAVLLKVVDSTDNNEVRNDAMRYLKEIDK